MTVTRALPPVLSSALPGIHWSLEGEAVPLHFQSLEQLQGIRQKQLQHATTTTTTQLWDNVPGTVESLFPLRSETIEPEQRHFGLISLGLILLGHGFTDECHNLITPLSWPEDIYFAHGPSVYATATPAVQAYSSYVHALVHRKEAFNTGEFGMVGFSNANYWSNAVARSAGVDSLPYPELRQRVLELAQEPTASKTPAVQEWCAAHGFVEPSSPQQQPNDFDARAVHQLCATVLRQKPPNPALRAFAENVVESEVRILLRQTLEKAGFTNVDDSTVLTWKQPSAETAKTMPAVTRRAEVDTDVALSVARKLSSAHLDLFRSQGSVILRQVAVDGDDDPVSVCAGLACRLLESPACVFVPAGEEQQRPDSGTESLSSTSMVEFVVGGGSTAGTNSGAVAAADLGKGDILVVRHPAAGPPSTGTAAAATTTDGASSTILRFEAVAPEDPSRTFVDPLYGSRGETPTTVIQWSKGTIF